MKPETIYHVTLTYDQADRLVVDMLRQDLKYLQKLLMEDAIRGKSEDAANNAITAAAFERVLEYYTG